MRKNYQNQEIDTSQPAVPDTVSVALAELAGEMREGLLALAVGTGLQVMTAIMEADVTAVCGPKGRHDPERTATRHGHGAGSVSLGGRRVPVQRPRMRAVDGAGELPVPAYAHPGDAGADLQTTVDLTIAPGERALVPTGIAIALPDGYVALVHPRSGLAARHGLSIVNTPGTVDAGYRGEIKVLLINHDRVAPVSLGRGDRIAQLHAEGVREVVLVPIGFTSDHVEVLYDLDVQAQERVAALDGMVARRAATVGTAPAFVQALRDLVVERLAAAEELPTHGAPATHDRCPARCCPAPARPAARPAT